MTIVTTLVIPVIVLLHSSANCADLVPYELLERDAIGSLKVAFDIRVQLVEGRLPTKEELGAISQHLYGNETHHDRTFVTFWLPGMVVGTGAFASTQHYKGKMEVQIFEFNLPDKYTGGDKLILPVYDSVSEMIEARLAFSESNGTFKLLKKGKVPHLQLSPMAYPRELHKVIIDEQRRAIINGVYSTIIHTHLSSVRVTAIHLVLDTKSKNHKYLKDYKVTIEITKEAATRIAKELLKVKTLRELVDLRKIDDEIFSGWSSSFRKGYYNENREPGLDGFYARLIRAAKHHRSNQDEL